MTSPLVALFTLEGLVMLLVWAVWVFLNLWIWQKAKSNGNLLMLVGAALLGLDQLLMMVSVFMGTMALSMIGLVVLTIGFYISVKPMVAAQIAALQSKMKHMTEGKPGGGTGTPPPSA